MTPCVTSRVAVSDAVGSGLVVSDMSLSVCPEAAAVLRAREAIAAAKVRHALEGSFPCIVRKRPHEEPRIEDEGWRGKHCIVTVARTPVAVGVVTEETVGREVGVQLAAEDLLLMLKTYATLPFGDPVRAQLGLTLHRHLSKL